MKIGLFGYGRMGQALERQAHREGVEVVACLSRPQQTTALEQADVLIDFSHPTAVCQALTIACQLKKPLVIGTTGWQVADLKERVQRAEIGIIHAANFALGAQRYLALIAHAQELFSDYDQAGVELHQRTKQDAPSGTAKLTHIPFVSLRCGEMPPTHTVYFSQSGETIEITHRIHDRSLYAHGALEAARWIQGRFGIYTLHDLIKAP